MNRGQALPEWRKNSSTRRSVQHALPEQIELTPPVHRALDELELVYPTVGLALTVGHDHRRYHRFHVLNQLHRESRQLGDPRRLGLICPLLQSPTHLLFASVLLVS